MSAAAMHVAKTGLNAQQMKMQVIANNLANVNTTGFKRDRVNFESLLYQVSKTAGAETADGTSLTSSSSVGTGVKIVSTQKLYTQGSLISTENAMDVAVDGAGFFQVLLPDGRTGYTRNGSFSPNSDGILTTSSGYILQPQIQIPPNVTEVNIAGNGTWADNNFKLCEPKRPSVDW
jgi:flagellar basal-body rod protein FlgG